MTADINKIFEMLSWNSPEDVQREGIEQAKNIKYISVLFQPVEDKSVWENCAKVICQKTDQELRHYLILMFEWLQDMNWPGFFIIYDRIKVMKPDFIISTYVYIIKEACNLKDENWLDYLAGLIENEELYELLPQEYQVIMKQHYDSFWKCS